MNTKVLASLGVVVALMTGFLVITLLKSNQVTSKAVVGTPVAEVSLPTHQVLDSSAKGSNKDIVKTTLDTHAQVVKTSLKVTK